MKQIFGHLSILKLALSYDSKEDYKTKGGMPETDFQTFVDP